jgi:hypothetical protein
MKDESKKIQYRLVEVKKLSYFENNLDDFNFKEKIDLSTVPFRLMVQLYIHDKEGILDIILRLNYFFKDSNKEYDLFGINTSHRFEIKDFTAHFSKNEKEEYSLPDLFFASLLGVTISGTRGMLVVLNAGHQYKDIVLPLLNPIDVLHSIKKH